MAGPGNRDLSRGPGCRGRPRGARRRDPGADRRGVAPRAAHFRRRRTARRRRLGEAALTRGLVALAADDAGEARRHAARATTLIDGSPTALLLLAEAAQRQGEPAAARQAYTALLERPDSEFLGLRGLVGQAMLAGEDDVARRLAERARLLRPGARWPADSLLVLEARAGDWTAARDTLALATRRGALPAAAVRHHRGVILYELSGASERRGALREAAGLAAKAQALAPDLAPLAVHHARLLMGFGRTRAAAKAIERAWRAAPHPELARAYADLQPDDEKLARTTLVQRLAGYNPAALETHLAIAEAALDARVMGRGAPSPRTRRRNLTGRTVAPALPPDGAAGGKRFGGCRHRPAMGGPRSRGAARSLLCLPRLRRRARALAIAVRPLQRLRHARVADARARRASDRRGFAGNNRRCRAADAAALRRSGREPLGGERAIG